MTSESTADDKALGDAFTSRRDSEGKSAPPAAKETAPPPAPKQEATPPPTAAPETPAEPSHQVPVRELLTEREKRKQEARLREEADANARKYRDEAAQLAARLEAIERAQRQPPPDPTRDPRGAMNYELQRIEARRIDDRAHQSEEMAIEKYGAELVEKARNAALQAGVAQHFYINSRNPYRDAVEWFKEQQVKAEIGTDLDGWRKRQADEIRKQVLAELQAGQSPDGASPPRFPTSLAGATNAGVQGAMPVTDEAMMGSIFSSQRDRRKG